VVFGGQLGEAIKSTPGVSIESAVLGDSALAIVFTAGAVWFSQDPFGDSESWYQGLDLTGDLNRIADGDNGVFVTTGDDGTFATPDNENFVLKSATPTNINHVIWEGLTGVYLATNSTGLLKTIDYGAGWGVLRPNTEFGTTWPGGAVGYQLSKSMGPRACDPAIEECTIPQAGLLAFVVSPGTTYTLPDGYTEIVNVPGTSGDMIIASKVNGGTTLLVEQGNAIAAPFTETGFTPQALGDYLALLIWNIAPEGGALEIPGIVSNVVWETKFNYPFPGTNFLLTLLTSAATQESIDDGLDFELSFATEQAEVWWALCDYTNMPDGQPIVAGAFGGGALEPEA
jgi:hypothetical protein